MNNIKSRILFILFGALLLAGCSGNAVNLQDGDTYVTKEMNEVISDYIIQMSSSSHHKTEKQFEIHKVYGINESDGVITVYMWSYYGGFNKSTGTEFQEGHSLPAVIQLSKNGEKFSVTEYIQPQDGDMYQSSLKKMFPKKYLKLVQQDTANTKNLQQEMVERVTRWLAKPE
ncbi:hypothetical protein MHI24_24065 [Paenibacillus sp. FSL K6-1096]|uniref:hypothetical protein n=1 Tax=Paenibacillus sp. FSL K6-1096 TaxID=2921460 RepID=UPI0030ED77B7